MIRFTLNGTQIEIEDGENRTLLEYLRKFQRNGENGYRPTTACRFQLKGKWACYTYGITGHTSCYCCTC